MKRLSALAIVSSLMIGGCGTKVSAPTQIGENLYNIDVEVIQLFNPEMNAKAAAIEKAKEFCGKSSKQIETRQIRALRTEDGATASIQFECR